MYIKRSPDSHSTQHIRLILRFFYRISTPKEWTLTKTRGFKVMLINQALLQKTNCGLDASRLKSYLDNIQQSWNQSPDCIAVWTYLLLLSRGLGSPRLVLYDKYEQSLWALFDLIYKISKHYCVLIFYLVSSCSRMNTVGFCMCFDFSLGCQTGFKKKKLGCSHNKRQITGHIGLPKKRSHKLSSVLVAWLWLAKLKTILELGMISNSSSKQ